MMIMITVMAVTPPKNNHNNYREKLFACPHFVCIFFVCLKGRWGSGEEIVDGGNTDNRARYGLMLEGSRRGALDRWGDGFTLDGERWGSFEV